MIVGRVEGSTVGSCTVRVGRGGTVLAARGQCWRKAVTVTAACVAGPRAADWRGGVEELEV